jgi:hypothetical protein
MSEYTVIPAAPGTVLVQVHACKRRGEKPQVIDSPVIAWRIPTAVDSMKLPIGVILGYEDHPFDRPSEFEVREKDGMLSVSAFMTAEGLISCRLDVRTREEFVTRAIELLVASLDDHFGTDPFEPIPFPSRSKSP